MTIRPGRARWWNRAVRAGAGIVLVTGLAGCGSGSGDADRLAAPAGSPTAAAPDLASAGPGSTASGVITGPGATPAERLAGPAGGTGITGLLQLNPCPTYQAKSCDAPRTPLAGVVMVSAGDGAATEVRTDAQGRFLVDLTPGRYRLTAVPDRSGPACAEVDVTVTAGEYLPADVDCS